VVFHIETVCEENEEIDAELKREVRSDNGRKPTGWLVGWFPFDTLLHISRLQSAAFIWKTL